ncbi:hypothetical protein DUI87_33595 [Hirundo rustica rustica]|uniref:F-box DNA helicase 1 n=1 Tax=Hirundo rustica rustica TaxID=333673 RepID=A0A3M0ISZ6_HIRRU|nr:hypothetical protein DUI87_33595 [Hirundo rustica rustica]
MRGSKRRHLTAPECEALARSAEGSAPLRRPLGLATGGGGGGGGGSRGLHPIHGTRRHPRGAARQRNILEFFAIQKRPEVGTAGMENCGIKEDPMDPVFPGSGDSFRSRAQSCGIRENPMDPVFPGPQESFRSRAQSCGIRENPMDPVFPGSQDSFRSRAQSCGITEEPLDLDPVFPGSQDSFRSRAQNCGIRQDPMDPIFPGESFRSTRNSGIRQDPMDPIYTEDSFWSRAQSCGIKEDPMDPIFPGSQDSFRSRAQSCGIKEDPMDPEQSSELWIKEEPLDLDPAFPGSQDSFRSRAQNCGIREDPVDPLRSPSSNPSPFPRSLPAPRAHSRKRPLPSAAASGIPNLQRDPWEEPEQKIPELSGIKQEMEEPEVEPLPDSHFGLLGTRNWDVPQGSLADLPTEILRNIFAFLPVLDLYQSLSLVCRCWREIIQDPLFIPWKKLYHRYLKREERALQRVEQILQEFSITKERRECVLGLVRLVSRTPTDPRVDPDAVLQVLGSHPLFPKARFCVLEKFPDLMSKPGPEKMWATLAVMVLFSDGVGDIWLLLERLRSPRSQLGALEVTEALHCMATLLFAMRDRRIPISNRIHYNIFYCLYLMENASGIVQPLEEGRVDSR